MNLEFIGMGILTAAMSAMGLRFGSLKVGGISGSASAVLILLGLAI